MTRAALTALLCVACGTDVLLGGDPDVVDAPNPFWPGNYVLLLFTEPPVIECQGSLVGHEPEFDRGRPAIGFVEGTLSLTKPTEGVVMVSGEPIHSAFGVASLTLRPGEAGTPAFTYAARLERDLPGPGETTLDAAFFALDSTSATEVSMVGRSGVDYTTPDLGGRCTVTYGASYGLL